MNPVNIKPASKSRMINMPAMPKFFALRSAIASIYAMPGRVPQVACPVPRQPMGTPTRLAAGRSACRHLRPPANVLQSLLPPHFAVEKHRLQQPSGHALFSLDGNRLEVVVAAHQRQAPALLSLAAVGHRLLVDFVALAGNGHLGTFEGELLGIAIELLQQRSSHAEGDVVG